MTLRLRLTLAFLLVIIVPLLVAAVVVGRGVPHTLTTAAENRLAASRAGALALVEETCADARLAAEVLAREATVRSAAGHIPAAAARRAVQDVVGRGLVGYAVVGDAGGGLVAHAGTLPSGAVVVSTSAVGSCTRGRPPAPAIAAIGDSVTVSRGGRTLGVAGVAVPLDAGWARRMASATNAGTTLVSAGRVIATTESPSVAAALAPQAASLDDVPSQRSGGRLATGIDVGSGRVVLVLSVSRPGVESLEVLLAVVLLIGLLLAFLIGRLLARVTTRPLEELSTAAARVAAGDLDTRIDTDSGDEVGRLAHAFNEMTEELRSYVGELETSRDELRRNLARLGDTLSSTHDLGRILTVILDTAMGSVRATAGAAYVQPSGRDELVLRASRGLERRTPAPRLPLGEGVTGSVAARGEAVRGLVGSDGISPSPLEPAATMLMSVPLRSSGGVLGVLNLYDRSDGQPFDAGDMETIRTFAGQAAVAIDNVFLHQEAQRLSVTDALTGLGNYRSFEGTMGREVDRAARFRRELGLLMLDLDLFKTVNDTHGHQVGDAVLVEVAARLLGQVREVDTVARYGGEEFVVVLPETGREGAGHTAERICAAVRDRPFVVGELSLTVTVSIGGAVFPANGDSMSALVRSADEALYAAKAAGRDRWRMSGVPGGDHDG